MNPTVIADRVETLATSFDGASFPFDLLHAYGVSKATIDKLRLKGSGLFDEGVMVKRKLWARTVAPGEVDSFHDAMLADRKALKKHDPAIVLVTDGASVVATDVKREETLRIDYASLPAHFDFLLPVGGIQRFEHREENVADAKASRVVAKLYDAICAHAPRWREPENRHAMNLFMTRLLFCMFADRTEIFEEPIFVRSVAEMTGEHGEDVRDFLTGLFAVLNLPRESAGRAAHPSALRRFPYVNGGLFREESEVPEFTAKARSLLIDAARMDWSEINPDIFGSMIQSVVHQDLRDDLGMHYTSVSNIMKVLRPIVFDDLEGQFSAAGGDAAKLRALLSRLRKIRFFDPACGSGNFLIVAYKELRALEMRVFERLRETGRGGLPMSEIRLDQFHGIEYDDFAAETAKLSLWIAQHQMNELQKRTFGTAPATLPLREGGRIARGNATRKDWLEVCPRVADGETYVVGNPPYLGMTYQTPEQKGDVAFLFKDVKGHKELDYVACWFRKAADYVSVSGGKAAFVTTNSICQGEQVALLWPSVFGRGVEIDFAHQSFKWRNNASNNAGVTVAIVGLRPRSKAPKLLFSGDVSREVRNVSPYLVEGEDDIVVKRSTSLSNLPLMVKGNQPTDGGNLILSRQERDDLLFAYPAAGRFIRRYVGSQEFVKGIERWCLWIDDAGLEDALKIAPVKARIEAVRQVRLASPAPSTVARAGQSHRFIQIQHEGGPSIVVPSVTSEAREYLTVGFVDGDTTVSNLAFAVYDAPEHVMAILSSRMMLVWAGAVGGRLEERLRYSNTLVWNTFPLPQLSAKQKEALTEHAREIVKAREACVGATIAELYHPKRMPDSLRKAHADLDEALETIYQGRPFADDTARLEHMFKLYRTMTAKAARPRIAA